MKPKTAKVSEWQSMGGKLVIPDGWFVFQADFDVIDPYVVIVSEDTNEERKILIPKALAYYLGTHFCGSALMRYCIAEDAKMEIRRTIRVALGL